jgi:hypothetical protein
MAVGGMIGGIAAGMIAPRMFDWIAEYPLLIIAAILCRPGIDMSDTRETRLFWIAALVALAILALPRFVLGYQFEENTFGGVVIVLLALALVVSRDPLRFAAVLALAFMFIRVYDTEAIGRTSIRSFFGVHKILDTPGSQYRVLMHGTTIHGAQQVRDADGKPLAGRPEPITYYTRNSGIGQAIAAVRENKGGPIRIAVVGLGTGSVACLTEEGDDVTYYEIDSSVVNIARDHFTFVEQCAPDAEVKLGDARQTLTDVADGSYDIIVVDAFSSDAIPIHLLTQEAMKIYLDKTAREGLVVLHVSNRHLELSSVVAGIAAANDAITRVESGDGGTNDEDEMSDTAYRYSTNVAVVGRSDEAFGPLAADEDWEVLEPTEAQRVWTDDYSNLIGALVRHMR